MLTFWGLAVLLTGPPLLLYAFVSGDIMPLYRVATKLAITGIRLAGVRIRIHGIEHVQAGRNYIFMSNHVSNLDPPILVPTIPGRCSVLVKKELFRIPILGTAMKLARLVPVDRHNREAAVESVRAAVEVAQSGLHMVIYPEGTRSALGRLMPFKKGPFHLAKESGIAVIPVTIVGTYQCWPKGRFALRAGTVDLFFHPAVDPAGFADRDALMRAVREAIASQLPESDRE